MHSVAGKDGVTLQDFADSPQGDYSRKRLDVMLTEIERTAARLREILGTE